MEMAWDKVEGGKVLRSPVGPSFVGVLSERAKLRGGYEEGCSKLIIREVKYVLIVMAMQWVR